jgi:hypothetical protein
MHLPPVAADFPALAFFFRKIQRNFPALSLLIPQFPGIAAPVIPRPPPGTGGEGAAEGSAAPTD